jgi:hypothetical protein
MALDTARGAGRDSGGAGLDRLALTLALAAIAHAAGSHEHHDTARDPDGVPHPGGRLPPLVAWPQPNLQ